MKPSVRELISLCNGEHSVANIQQYFSSFNSTSALAVLEDLDYIVFQEVFHVKRNPPKGRMLIVSPHMDDAFLSLGGTILRARSHFDITVLDVFGYDPWICSDISIQISKEEQNCIRIREERFNARLTEIKLILWDYPGSLSRGYRHWNAPIDWQVDQLLVRDIKQQFRKAFDLASFQTILVPLGIGCHTDHALMRKIMEQLVRELHLDCEVLFYEDLPYATTPAFWKTWWHKETKQPTMGFVYVGIDSWVRQKYNLLATYSSQLSSYEPVNTCTYHDRSMMFTGIQLIDSQHKAHMQRFATARHERLWKFG